MKVARVLVAAAVIGGCSAFGGSDLPAPSNDAGIASEAGALDSTPPIDPIDGGAEDAEASTGTSAIKCSTQTAIVCDDFDTATATPFGAASAPPDGQGQSTSLVMDPRGTGKSLRITATTFNPIATNANLVFEVSSDGSALAASGQVIHLSFAYQVVGAAGADYAVLGALAVFQDGAPAPNLFGIATANGKVKAVDDNSARALTPSAMDNVGGFHRVDILVTKHGNSLPSTLTWTATWDGRALPTSTTISVNQAITRVQVWTGQFYTGTNTNTTTVFFDDIIVTAP